MSHRWDCPTDYEARRRGERDYESYGYRRYSTPYDDECPDARDAYLRGQRNAEYRAEEEAEQRRYAMAQQAAREQAELEENRRAYYAEQEHQQYLDAMREQENEYTELLEMIELAEEMAVIQ